MCYHFDCRKTMQTARRRVSSSVVIVPAFVAWLLLSTAVDATPPVAPIDPPLYAFDAASPSVQGGVVGSSDVLRLGFPNPKVFASGANVGLGAPGDEIDAMSGDNGGVGATDTFILLFSVDRGSVGNAAPLPVLDAQSFPYNVQDQANRSQAVGDQYMTLDLFTRGGPVPSQGVAGVISNNSLVRNNGDEGGTDFAAEPDVSAEESVPAADPKDNVTATAKDPNAAVAGFLGGVYFSASAASPSLAQLPSPIASGANLFFNANPLDGIAMTQLFASANDLGLQAADDIKATIVFDLDGDGVFGGSDQVLFTLSAGSPSLGTIPGGKVGSPADVFSVTFGIAPTVFARASLLGLGNPADAVDALEFELCLSPADCDPTLRSIGRGPVPAVSAWGMVVLVIGLLCTAMIVLRRRAYN